MKPIKTTQAFAQLVTDTVEGRIRWLPKSKPLADKERGELAEMQANPYRGDAYSAWLASSEDFLSRFKREHNIADEEG